MSYCIQTAPDAETIEIAVRERKTGPVIAGRQTAEILTFTCAQVLQFSQIRARLRDEAGVCYEFTPLDFDAVTNTYAGYIKSLK